MSEHQRIRITKQLLKDSLIKLLRKKSIHKISVTELCKAAEVNRTTFYKYYGSPYALFDAIEQDVCNEIGRFLDNSSAAVAAVSPSSSIDAILDVAVPYLTQVFTFINEHLELGRLLLSGNMSPNFPEKLILSLRNMPQSAKASLAEIYGEEHAEYAFEFMMSGCFAFIKKWVNEEHRKSPEEMANLLGTLTASLRGVGH